jgi:hypothetical protein
MYAAGVISVNYGLTDGGRRASGSINRCGCTLASLESIFSRSHALLVIIVVVIHS